MMTDKPRGLEMLLNVLTAHYRSLSAARCDEAILAEYSKLLRVLRSNGAALLEGRLTPKTRKKPPPKSSSISDVYLRDAALDEIEKMLNNEGTSRADLEQIAITRFSVPGGSMRRFSNRRTSRTHSAITSWSPGLRKPWRIAAPVRPLLY
jgi:hypothetical protein